MDNFNEEFTVPNDDAWHAVAAVGGGKNASEWFELTVEAGRGRIALCTRQVDPNAGQPLDTNERYTLPRGSGYVYMKAEGGSAMSGTMSGVGEAL